MTPAPNPPPVAESVEVQRVEDMARELLAHEYSMRGQPSVALLIRGAKSLNPDGPYAAAVAAIAASHEAGRIAGVREGLERAAKVAEGERPKNPVSDWTDYARTRDFAATTIAKLIRALSKGEIDGE